MNTYRITVVETIEHYVTLRADNEETAMDVAVEYVSKGEMQMPDAVLDYDYCQQDLSASDYEKVTDLFASA